jgi:hypothetical protein
MYFFFISDFEFKLKQLFKIYEQRYIRLLVSAAVVHDDFQQFSILACFSMFVEYITNVYFLFVFDFFRFHDTLFKTKNQNSGSTILLIK